MSSAIFDFDSQKTFAQSIELEDIGNCALRCTNPAFEDYYIITQTSMGKTYILKFGPLVADLTELNEDFNLSYKKIDYKETIITKEINLLLNDTKKKINQVMIIELSEALEQLPTSDAFIPE